MKLISEFLSNKVLFYGTLLLFTALSWKALYMLTLEVWCIAYGLIY